jgi:hypothetical protein
LRLRQKVEHYQPTKTPMQHIQNFRALRQALAKGQRGFKVHLNGGVFSRKRIKPRADGRFRVINCIDGSVQTLTGRQLYTRSIIGEAMQKKAFTDE